MTQVFQSFSEIHRYPKSIAQLQQQVATCDSAVDLHRALFKAAESIVKYLALVVWNEYRSMESRVLPLERFVASRENPSFGDWLRLLRQSSKAARPSILAQSIMDAPAVEEMEPLADFVRVWQHTKRACEYCIPEQIGGYVKDMAGSRQRGRVTLLQYFGDLVECRNREAHGVKKQQHPYPIKEVATAINPTASRSG